MNSSREAKEAAMKENLQNALDDVVSSRSSSTRRSRGLRTIEELLADSCSAQTNLPLGCFMSFQDDFECNVPSRILPWISRTTKDLEEIAASPQKDEEQIQILSSQLSESLTIVQGVALNHNSTKTFLGRKYPLEVLLDLLLMSRQLPSSMSTMEEVPSSILASMVLDTLLCILVDSPLALRAFEACEGVEVVVKILKHSSIARGVRMKCLEFLYFYLLDEKASEQNAHPRRQSRSLSPNKQQRDVVTSDAPNPRPLHSDDSLLRSTPPRKHYSSPTKLSVLVETNMVQPPATPTMSSKRRFPERLHLPAFRKEIDYEPMSPLKGGRPPFRGSLEASLAPSPRFPSSSEGGQSLIYTTASSQDARAPFLTGGAAYLRTTEEKKEILGGLLGNVDALVEGVRKSGIWGLG